MREMANSREMIRSRENQSNRQRAALSPGCPVWTTVAALAFCFAFHAAGSADDLRIPRVDISAFQPTAESPGTSSRIPAVPFDPAQADISRNIDSILNGETIPSPVSTIVPPAADEELTPDKPLPPLPESNSYNDGKLSAHSSELIPFSYHTGPGCPSPFAGHVPYDPSVPEEEEPCCYQFTESFLEALGKPAEPMTHFFECVLHSEHDEPETDLEHCAIGIQPIPERPPLLLEWNEEFLAPGFLEQGIVLPTGAVWRPSLWVFGTFRTGLNYFDNGAAPSVGEWANRLDLFGQLNLSGTERIVLGLRPLDEETLTARQFSGYDIKNGNRIDAWNAEPQTLFFDGDFGEIFPNLDPYDRLSLDYGFSVGRQPMFFQQGLLLNDDRIDALTITRNTLYGNGNLNFRGTFAYAWNQINRHDGNGPNRRDNGSQLVGFFTESDYRLSTVNADLAYVWSDDNFGNLFVAGLSGIQRLNGFHNTYNSSMHLLASFPTDGETPYATQGELLFHQFSWTPHHTNDLIFLNSFWAIDEFTSASRGPLAGGPLGQAGLLFSAAGLGRYGAPLSNEADNVVGGSLGYQMFYNDLKEQVVFELGGRQDTNASDTAAVASGIRYQRALDQHWLFIIDAFVNKREATDIGQGVRFEMQSKF